MLTRDRGNNFTITTLFDENMKHKYFYVTTLSNNEYEYKK